MISPLGIGHRGGTLSITSSRALYSRWGWGSSSNRGGCNRHARAGAGCDGREGDGGRGGTDGKGGGGDRAKALSEGPDRGNG